MKKMMLGIATAAVLVTAAAAPAMAQVGFYVGPGGVGVGVGGPYYGGYPYGGYYGGYYGPRAYVGPRWHRWRHRW
jgi:hypothetical protein